MMYAYDNHTKPDLRLLNTNIGKYSIYKNISCSLHRTFKSGHWTRKRKEEKQNYLCFVSINLYTFFNGAQFCVDNAASDTVPISLVLHFSFDALSDLLPQCDFALSQTAERFTSWCYAIIMSFVQVQKMTREGGQKEDFTSFHLHNVLRQHLKQLDKDWVKVTFQHSIEQQTVALDY